MSVVLFYLSYNVLSQLSVELFHCCVLLDYSLTPSTTQFVDSSDYPILKLTYRAFLDRSAAPGVFDISSFVLFLQLVS